MPEKVVHRLAEIIRFRMLMIAAGYEDGNDADTLRDDPEPAPAQERVKDLVRGALGGGERLATMARGLLG